MAVTYDDVRVLTWDHREQFPFDEFRAAQADGYLYLATVDDTGSDQYVAYASAEPLSAADAQGLFDDFQKEYLG